MILLKLSSWMRDTLNLQLDCYQILASFSKIDNSHHLISIKETNITHCYNKVSYRCAELSTRLFIQVSFVYPACVQSQGSGFILD